MLDSYGLLQKFIGGLLLTIPIYSIHKVYQLWQNLNKEFKEYQLFMKKHNCVVMYHPPIGIYGWPGRIEKCKNINRMLDELYEPIIYFIDTAKKSLCIAMMVLADDRIMHALIRAIEREVSVKVITDSTFNQTKVTKQLIQKGGLVLYYVCPDSTSSSIFHYKYLIKDDDSNGNGFLGLGSLNWTSTAIQQNFEDFVFTTKPHAIQQFRKNFDKSWEFINDLNETNFYCKTMLKKICRNLQDK